METFAQKLFAAWFVLTDLEAELLDRVVTVLGADKDDVSTWPIQDVWFDHYDGSLELMDCADGLVLTDAQQAAIADLGFVQCWLNAPDRQKQKERHYLLPPRASGQEEG